MTTFPISTRERYFRIALVLLSSICWLAALLLWGSEAGWRWMSVLIAGGIVLRLGAYLFPRRWLGQSSR